MTEAQSLAALDGYSRKATLNLPPDQAAALVESLKTIVRDRLDPDHVGITKWQLPADKMNQSPSPQDNEHAA